MNAPCCQPSGKTLGGALDRDPANIIFNQFCEFGNYLIHRVCTGAAMEKLFGALAQGFRSRRRVLLILGTVALLTGVAAAAAVLLARSYALRS